MIKVKIVDDWSWSHNDSSEERDEFNFTCNFIIVECFVKPLKWDFMVEIHKSIS
jgi:hypothetical protein